MHKGSLYNSSLHVSGVTRVAWAEVESFALGQARKQASEVEDYAQAEGDTVKSAALQLSENIQNIAEEEFRKKLEANLTEQDQKHWSIDTLVQQKAADFFGLQDRVFDILLGILDG